jgi:hypothetical protein
VPRADVRSTDVIAAPAAGLPNTALLEAVRQALHDHELMGFDARAKAPDARNIAVRIEYSGGADEADAALAAESCVHGLGIGGRFTLRELYALLDPLSLETAGILPPERDARAGGSEIIMAVIDVLKAGAWQAGCGSIAGRKP